MRKAIAAAFSTAVLFGGAPAALAATDQPTGVAKAPTTAPPHPLLPTADPFYTYAGPLAHIAPGTVLKARKLSVGTSSGLDVTQVLYRTTGELGEPTVTAATIVAPEHHSRTTRILAYQEAYDGLGPQCEPSYELQFGLGDLKVIGSYATSGLTFVIADYEGTHFEWTAGQEAGYATLDGVRAAENLMHLPQRSTPVGLVGYSGGAIATDFATELAPKYAPGLDIVGAAEGGLAVDLAHNLQYINGSRYWSAVIPMALVGLARAFHVDLSDYLSPYGKSVTAAVAGQCLGSVAGKYPGLTVQQLFLPRYKDIYTVPAFVRILNRLIMGRTGTPRAPLFIGEGNSDGTGDGVMVFKDVEALARTYCERGTSVDF
ncbi:MAG: lipase family protein, partial [Acidimicrobiales bacterium]